MLDSVQERNSLLFESAGGSCNLYFILFLSRKFSFPPFFVCLFDRGTRSPVLDSPHQPWTDEFFKLFRKRLRIPFRKFQTLEQFRVGCGGGGGGGGSPRAGGFYLYYGWFSETFWSLEFIFSVTFKPVKNKSHMCKRE